YDTETKRYHIHRNRKFRTYIPLEMRVRYFIVSYLRRLEYKREFPTFDQIVLNIMPLLKNGSTPERQTILGVLRTVAEHAGKDRWRLIKTDQRELALF